MKVKILWNTTKRRQACLLSILFIHLMIKVGAQSVLSNTSAANESFGSRNATATGMWSMWCNPAGLASADRITVGFGLGQHRAVPLATQSALMVVNTSIGAACAGIVRLGDNLYSEQALSFGFANKLDITALGIRADVFQLMTDGNPTHRTIGITVGGIISAGKHVKVGANARNINLPKWQSDEKLPVMLNAGVLYQPSNEFTGMFEVEKNTDLHPTYKAGFEYNFRKKVYFRTGVNLFPNAAFGGIGLSAWRFTVDYALRYSVMPGYHHQLSISTSLKARSQRI